MASLFAAHGLERLIWPFNKKAEQAVKQAQYRMKGHKIGVHSYYMMHNSLYT